MKNIMVCVTQQKTCERLIQFGYQLLEKSKEKNAGELFIIHVAHYQFNFLGNSKEGVALEYLYEKALEFGANLTVVRSNDVIATLADLIHKNKITHVVAGASGDAQSNTNMMTKLQESISETVELIIVP